MLLVLAEATCSEILDIADSDEQENIESSYEKICQLVKKSTCFNRLLKPQRI